MPFANVHGHRIRYALHGQEGYPLVTFVNGLTQNADLWTAYGNRLADRGYRVLAYDMLGQGQSSKPVLGVELSEHADLLAGLLDVLDAGPTHLAGISFGGVVALDFAVRHGERLAGLVVMSSFAELTPQLELLGNVLYEGLTQVGLTYLQSMLYPMNMSSAWLAANRERIPSMMRSGYIGNDLYALQNLMESFIAFKPLTPRLKEIRGPVLLMNGEHDFFTPRECHELMRSELPNCRLLLIQHAYHAFTLELPEITLRQLHEFFRSVDDETWVGDGTVWIAADRADADPHAFACVGDHLRAVPLPALAAPPPASPAAPAAALSRKAAPGRNVGRRAASATERNAPPARKAATNRRRMP
ncbi:MAG: alpha/beta hydrolase [Burkholderiaceae bacterium]|jgi:pimeloyl-ACP methyl ester carboxylesterase|nr:alpha/beta hydrolase [Burkholderiaceae bacterium]